jgi:hypothetical protein
MDRPPLPLLLGEIDYGGIRAATGVVAAFAVDVQGALPGRHRLTNSWLKNLRRGVTVVCRVIWTVPLVMPLP